MIARQRCTDSEKKRNCSYLHGWHLMNCHGQDGVNQVVGCFPVSVFRDLASLKLDHNCLPHSMLKEIEKRTYFSPVQYSKPMPYMAQNGTRFVARKRCCVLLWRVSSVEGCLQYSRVVGKHSMCAFLAILSS